VVVIPVTPLMNADDAQTAVRTSRECEKHAHYKGYTLWYCQHAHRCVSLRHRCSPRMFLIRP